MKNRGADAPRSPRRVRISTEHARSQKHPRQAARRKACPRREARAYAACTFRRLGAAPSPRELWLKTVWSLGGFAMRTTTMKTTSLRIFGALLVLSVLWMMAPGVRAEDPIERLNETGQYQAKLFQETVQEYQDLRNSADEINSMRQDAQPAPPVAGLALPPAAPVAGPVAAPQVRFPAQAVPQHAPDAAGSRCVCADGAPESGEGAPADSANATADYAKARGDYPTAPAANHGPAAVAQQSRVEWHMPRIVVNVLRGIA